MYGAWPSYLTVSQQVERHVQSRVGCMPLGSGSSSLASLPSSAERVKNPTAPGGLPCDSWCIVGAQQRDWPKGEWGGWLRGPGGCQRTAAVAPRLPALQRGTEACISTSPDKTLENDLLFPPLPRCACAVFTVGERSLCYFHSA